LIQFELKFSALELNDHLSEEMRLSFHYFNFKCYEFHDKYCFNQEFIDCYFVAVTNEEEANFFVSPSKNITVQLYQV